MKTQVNAARTYRIGPILDQYGTPYVTATIASTNFLISKNGAAGVNPHDTTGAVQDGNQGHYLLALDATDHNTEGVLNISLELANYAAPPLNVDVCAVRGGPAVSASQGSAEVPYNETVHFDVVTHHPVTGAASDADSAPTFEVFVETADTPVYYGAMTKRTGKTGNYHGSFLIYGGFGFEVGRFYNVVASATVAGVTGKTIVMAFRVMQEEATVGRPQVNSAAIDNSTTAAANLKAACTDGLATTAQLGAAVAPLATTAGLGALSGQVDAVSAVTDKLAEIDGVDIEKALNAILATAAGKVSVTDNGDSTYTAVFKRQDGTTTALSVTYNPTTGERAVTATIP